MDMTRLADLLERAHSLLGERVCENCAGRHLGELVIRGETARICCPECRARWSTHMVGQPEIRVLVAFRGILGAHSRETVDLG
jgi:hypothetical protein